MVQTNNRKVYCMFLISLLLIGLGASSQFFGGLAYDGERRKESLGNGSQLLFHDGLVNASGVSSASGSADVLLGYMGSPWASNVLLFYNPSLKHFTLKYHVEVSGEYFSDSIMRAAVTRIFVAYSLYYSDTGQTLMSNHKSFDYVLEVTDEGGCSFLSEPRWQYLKWNFIGILGCKDRQAVDAETQGETVHWCWRTFEWAATFVAIVGIAALTFGTSLPITALGVCELVCEATIHAMGDLCLHAYAYGIYKFAQGMLDSYKAAGSWSCVIIGVDDYIGRDPDVNVDVAGPNRGYDTRDLTYENSRGPYEIGNYVVHVKAYRINKIQIEFTTPEYKSEIIDAVTLEGDPDSPRPSYSSHKVTFQKEAYYSNIGDRLYKLMKHDVGGHPYIELFFRVPVDYEVEDLYDHDPNWIGWMGSYADRNQYFNATVTVQGASGTGLYSKEAKSELPVTVHFVFSPAARKATVIVISLALLPLYIIFDKIGVSGPQPMLIIIPYPPYTSAKYMLAHPPHTPETRDFSNIQYVGPKPPPENIAVEVPDPSFECAICIPQIPTGQEWKITLRYESAHPFYYGQVVFIYSAAFEAMQAKKCNVAIYIPCLEKYVYLNPPSAEECLATTVTSPSNVMFIFPTLPQMDEMKVIHVTNPDEALLVTTQTTLAYPLKISVNDVPRTTFVKVPSGGDLDLRVLKAGYGPSPTISDEQVGIYVNAGESSSSFEYYFMSRKVAHGTLDIPPLVTYEVDYPYSGLTFTRDDSFPKINATLQNLVSAAIQLVGHGVDLSYFYTAGAYVTSAFKLIVKNTGIVQQDIFNLSIVECPLCATAILGNKTVTLDPGESTEVDLNVTVLPVLNHMFGPETTHYMTGVNDEVYSGSYCVKAKAVCNAKQDVSDTVKVPAGLAVPFKSAFALERSMPVNTTLTYQNSFIRLKGNLTVEAGGRLALENSTVLVDPDEGQIVGIAVDEGGEIILNDSLAASRDDKAPWEFGVRGTMTAVNKAWIKNSRVNLLNNLELSSGSQLILSNSVVEVGKEGLTPTIVVHQGSLLNLLDSTIRSFNPSKPYPMRGGGRIVRFESKTADFLSCGLKIETLSHSLHIRYPEAANYPVRITNTGNQTDQVTLHLEKNPATSEWMAELDQTVFTLTPGQAAVTVLHVRRLTPAPTSQILEADVIGESFNDAEVSCSLRTFTKIVEPYSSPQIDLDGYDIFLTEERPIEGKTVEVKAVIHNNGDQPAYDVVVTFSDQTASQIIDTVAVPQVAARSFVIVTAQWNIRSASVHMIATTTQYSGGTKQAVTGIAVKSCPQGSSSVMIDEDPPLIAYTGQPIYFDAFNFTDVDGNICECLWDFGDGSHASGPLLLYSYWEDGVYNVTVRVIDDYGAETTKSTQLTILNRPPTVSLAVAPSCAWINESVTFNASSSFDLDGNITQCVWNFGDGNLGNGTTAVHKYASPTIYNVTLAVTDNDGASSSMETQVTILMKQVLLGDLNGDGVVNIIDVAIVARAFGCKPGDPGWNPVADMDGNGLINIVDVAKVAREFGKTA